MDLKVLGKMPIDPSLAELSDKGDFAKAENKYLTDAFEVLHQLDRVKKKRSRFQGLSPTYEQAHVDLDLLTTGIFIL